MPDLTADTFLKFDDASATAAATDYADGNSAQKLAFDAQRQLDDYRAAHPDAPESDPTIQSLRATLKSYTDTVQAKQQSLGQRIADLVKLKGYDKHATGGWRHEVLQGGVTLLKVKQSAK